MGKRCNDLAITSFSVAYQKYDYFVFACNGENILLPRRSLKGASGYNKLVERVELKVKAIIDEYAFGSDLVICALELMRTLHLPNFRISPYFGGLRVLCC